MIKTEPNRIEAMQERQKLRNDKSKYWAAVIGQNMSIAVCMMIPVFVVALIWTETTPPELGASLAMQTILTAALFVFAEWSAMNVGVPSGKLDDDYLRLQEEFAKRKAEVKARGILKMGVFCDWQIDQELISAKKALCRKLKIDWRVYKREMAPLSKSELIDKYGKIKGQEIWYINNLDTIELTPELILGENLNGGRGGISISGDDYVSKQKYGKMNLVKSVLTIVVTVGIGFVFSPGITWGKIVFTFYRLIAVFMRMKVGFDKGARAYNTVEVKHRESQIYYMDKYEEFLDTEGLYEAAAEKYGDTVLPVSKEITTNEAANRHVDQQRAEEDYRNSESERGAAKVACLTASG